jgi:hypothetical protein
MLEEAFTGSSDLFKIVLESFCAAIVWIANDGFAFGIKFSKELDNRFRSSWLFMLFYEFSLTVNLLRYQVSTVTDVETLP